MDRQAWLVAKAARGFRGSDALVAEKGRRLAAISGESLDSRPNDQVARSQRLVNAAEAEYARAAAAADAAGVRHKAGKKAGKGPKRAPASFWRRHGGKLAGGALVATGAGAGTVYLLRRQSVDKALPGMPKPPIAAGFKTAKPAMPAAPMAPKPPKAGLLTPTGRVAPGKPGAMAPRIPRPPKVAVGKGVNEVKRVAYGARTALSSGKKFPRKKLRGGKKRGTWWKQEQHPDYAMKNPYLYERGRAAANGRHLAREIAESKKAGIPYSVPKAYTDRTYGRGDTVGMYADFGRENRAIASAHLERAMKDRVQPRRLP